MDYVVKLDAKKIIKNHNLDPNGEVNKRLRNEVDRFCTPYEPRNVGELDINKRYPDNSTIVYASPYAHYIYKGEKMVAPNGSSWARKGEKKHYTGEKLNYQGAPKRGANWVERMLNDRRTDLVNSIQNFIDGGR